MLDCERGIALHAMQGDQASFSPRGKSHGFSQVAAGTWGIFSSYGADLHSKLEFVQRIQHTGLGMTDTSAM